MTRTAAGPTLTSVETTMLPLQRRRSGYSMAGLLLGAGLLFLPQTLSAQLSAGWTGGGATLSELNRGSGASVELKPAAGPVLGLHVDRWYGDDERFAVRLQGAWQQARFDWTQGERKIDAVSGDVSLLIRALTPGGEDGLRVLPHLVLGLGGMWYDLGRGSEVGYPAAGSYHDGTSTIVPLVVFGGGVDVALPLRWFGNPLRLRMEAADHLALHSPLRNLTDGGRQGAIHNLRLTLGAYSVVDLLRIR